MCLYLLSPVVRKCKISIVIFIFRLWSNMFRGLIWLFGLLFQFQFLIPLILPIYCELMRIKKEKICELASVLYLNKSISRGMLRNVCVQWRYNSHQYSVCVRAVCMCVSWLPDSQTLQFSSVQAPTNTVLKYRETFPGTVWSASQ